MSEDNKIDVQTNLPLQMVKSGEKANQQIATISTINLSVGPEALVGVVKTSIRVSLDKAIARQVRLLAVCTKAVLETGKAVAEKQHALPEDFMALVENLLPPLRPFYPDVCVRWRASPINVTERRHYQVFGELREHSGPAGDTLFTLQRTLNISEASLLSAFKAYDDAQEARQAVETELVRLRTERSRLNELAEEAAAALVKAQMAQVAGGDDYLAALQSTGDQIRARLNLPAEGQE